MKLENEQLIKEFHNKMSEKYPNIILEQAKDIAFTPWKFLKQEIENGELPEVRFKYFGTFQVYHGRAVNMLENLKERFRYNKINRDMFYKTKDMLEKFIKKDV